MLDKHLPWPLSSTWNESVLWGQHMRSTPQPTMVPISWFIPHLVQHQNLPQLSLVLSADNLPFFRGLFVIPSSTPFKHVSSSSDYSVLIWGSSEMCQWIKTITMKSDNLSSRPGTHRERINFSSCPLALHVYTHTQTHTAWYRQTDRWE